MGAKEDFIKEAESVRRFNMEKLLEWLDKTDFYQAPASSMYHGSHEGGLLLHSLAVLDVARNFVDSVGLNVQAHSLTLICLFHDLCKIGYYKLDETEASDAQIRKVSELLDERGLDKIPRDQRTKRYVSQAIDDLLKDKELPVFKPYYMVKEELPLGHGEKSIYLIMRHIQLSEEEALAIRWHLAGFDPGTAFNYPSGSPCRQAFRDSLLTRVLACADFSATYLVDEW